MSLRPAELTDGWQRLDPRMLLVHPVRELLRFLPALAGLFIAGAASGGMDLRWQVIGVAFPVVVGLMRYLTTSYRITEDRVELRRGLLERHLLSSRLDRVRTVDLTASPVHRLLGLSTVRIGTGSASTSEEDRIDLDGLPADRARSLRHDLLLAGPAPTDQADPDDEHAPAPPPAVDTVLLGLDPRWARFAPLTTSGLAIGAGVVGVTAQLGGELRFSLDRDDLSRVMTLLPVLVLAVVAGAALFAVGAYLVTNWGFTLARTGEGAWHLRRGLLTTRETTIDDARVGGVTVGEPLGLRLGGAARLSAIVTGLDRQQQGSSMLVPPAPREVVDGVAAHVLGTPAPVTGGLTPHGRAATRRRWTRALVPALLVSALLVTGGLVADVGAVWVLLPAALLPLGAALLATDRARGLGHALVDGYVVARSGSLLRRREALAADAVIGWTFRATWFQRRAGLTSLVATTAGGPQAVTVLDVPEGEAVGLARAAHPDLVGQFTA